MKNNNMNLKIIDKELSLASCGMADGDKTIYLYLPQRDWIVLNDNRSDFWFYSKAIREYLELQNFEKKEMLEYARNNKELGRVFELYQSLNRTLRVRRKLYGGAA